MIVRLLQIYVGLLAFALGWFWACVAIPRILLTAFMKGRKGILKLFSWKNHSQIPKVATVGFEHDYLRTRSGLRFHYVHTGDNDLPLMLCLHGFPECWYSWNHILKGFSSDYHVVAIDMRGYGDTDKPKYASKYHIDYLVTDVREIISSFGQRQAVLVGHDWGGVVAFEVALCFPEVISRLIVMNAPSRDCYMNFILRHPSQFLRSWYAFLYQLPILPEWLTAIDDYKPLTHFFRGHGPMGIKNVENCLREDEIEVYKNSACRHIRYGINYYRAVNPIYRGMNLPRRNDKVLLPTLLLWGKQDKALDVRLAINQKKYVPNMKIVYFDEASHWLQQDEPEKVIKEMKEFLLEEK